MKPWCCHPFIFYSYDYECLVCQTQGWNSKKCILITVLNIFFRKTFFFFFNPAMEVSATCVPPGSELSSFKNKAFRRYIFLSCKRQDNHLGVTPELQLEKLPVAKRWPWSNPGVHWSWSTTEARVKSRDPSTIFVKIISSQLITFELPRRNSTLFSCFQSLYSGICPASCYQPTNPGEPTGRGKSPWERDTCCLQSTDWGEVHASQWLSPHCRDPCCRFSSAPRLHINLSRKKES